MTTLETVKEARKLDTLDLMIAWEEGDISEDDEVKLFQILVDSGMAWTLQGMYGRRAEQLITEGLVTR
jgi:hypothetical protein